MRRWSSIVLCPFYLCFPSTIHLACQGVCDGLMVFSVIVDYLTWHLFFLTKLGFHLGWIQHNLFQCILILQLYFCVQLTKIWCENWSLISLLSIVLAISIAGKILNPLKIFIRFHLLFFVYISFTVYWYPNDCLLKSMVCFVTALHFEYDGIGVLNYSFCVVETYP